MTIIQKIKISKIRNLIFLSIQSISDLSCKFENFWKNIGNFEQIFFFKNKKHPRSGFGGPWMIYYAHEDIGGRKRRRFYLKNYLNEQCYRKFWWNIKENVNSHKSFYFHSTLVKLFCVTIVGLFCIRIASCISRVCTQISSPHIQSLVDSMYLEIQNFNSIIMNRRTPFFRYF